MPVRTQAELEAAFQALLKDNGVGGKTRAAAHRAFLQDMVDTLFAGVGSGTTPNLAAVLAEGKIAQDTAQLDGLHLRDLDAGTGYGQMTYNDFVFEFRNELGTVLASLEEGTLFLKSQTGSLRLSTQASGVQQIAFPDNSGTVALLSDIPVGGGLTKWVSDPVNFEPAALEEHTFTHGLGTDSLSVTVQRYHYGFSAWVDITHLADSVRHDDPTKTKVNLKGLLMDVGDFDARLIVIG